MSGRVSARVKEERRVSVGVRVKEKQPPQLSPEGDAAEKKRNEPTLILNVWRIRVKRSKVNISSFIFLLTFGVLIAVSCNKEYSYEGDLPDPAVIVPGGAGTGNGLYPFCNDCKGHDKFEYGRWSFWVGNSFFCGNITDGVASPDRKGFTFFGPSSCSTDTGLIMTIYLPNIALMGDMYNIVSTKTLMQYYDNITPSDMFVSRNNAEMTLIVDQYIQSTLISRGRFFGKVYDKQGSVINVTNGKFEFKFRN